MNEVIETYRNYKEEVERCKYRRGSKDVRDLKKIARVTTLYEVSFRTLGTTLDEAKTLFEKQQ